MLTWKKILYEIITNKWKEPIKIKSIKNFFNISSADATIRMHDLRLRNFLDYYIKNEKGYGGYKVTDKGKEYIDIYINENVVTDTNTGIKEFEKQEKIFEKQEKTKENINKNVATKTHIINFMYFLYNQWQQYEDTDCKKAYNKILNKIEFNHEIIKLAKRYSKTLLDINLEDNQ